MKIKLLAVVGLVVTVTLTGCDGDNKTDCKKDPTSKGCPRYGGNITSSATESWDMNSQENNNSQKDK